jgi:DNA helicase-2/ATP-dependent DNA helicase PcrA
MHKFDEEYKKLNPAQKDAVDSIEGPVMVVAGPGTGKTQVLALRIGNILKKTDIKSDGILCLTFTNSAVKAMRDRLRAYIGPEAAKVRIATFHSFALEIIERYHSVLGLVTEPKLLDEQDAIAFADEILEGNDWKYIRPRSDTPRYFNDLKSLVSMQKRERISSDEFRGEIEREIKNLENDPGSISQRGDSKGKIKKEVATRIEGLARTLEAVEFYDIYEEKKKERGLFDYDDVLEALVRIVEDSPAARGEIREEFLYVLIDEHQDSSGIQNEFLKIVWGNEEKPNIFVVGDDRQLIYGFGGASLEYFENFKNEFKGAKLITLVENYRSTSRILDASHDLLQSSITKEKLKSNKKDDHPIRLVEAEYPRDEIIAAGLEIKKKIAKEKIDPNKVAILVPKNRQVRSTIEILKDLGLPTARGEAVDFFEVSETESILRVLKILAYPEDGVPLGASFFDPIVGINPIEAHKFLRKQDMKNFSLLDVEEPSRTLFGGGDESERWLKQLKDWLEEADKMSLYSLVQKVGSDHLLRSAKTHEILVTRIEVLRTLLHLLLSQIEKNPKLDLKSFVSFLERIESYGEKIPLATFGKEDGVKVLTLHGSKGLEFTYVWIAHMDEKSFMEGRRGGFTIPEGIKERIERRDELVKKRELYVAITRAEKYCTISYATNSYSGASQQLAGVVAELDDHLEKQTAEETEKVILAADPKSYVVTSTREGENVDLKKLIKIVAEDYEDRKVSVSLLNNFFECPWKWYFRNLLQLPEAKTKSLEFGDLVHRAVDQILKMDKPPKEGDISLLVFGNTEAEKAIMGFIRESYPNIKKDRKNEQSVSLKDERYPHLDIYGRIDLIENLGGRKVRVTDFKTGNAKKKSDIEKQDEEGRPSSLARQLAMYSYLLSNSPKWKVEVAEAILEFLEAKKPEERFYRTSVADQQVELLVKDIQDYDNLLKSGEWTNRKCNFNSYGKAGTVCEYCKLAEIYK